MLRRALNQALRWGLVARNVATLVDTPRIEQGVFTPLDSQQARRLLRGQGDRLEALYRIALSLGLRRGEILGSSGRTSTSRAAHSASCGRFRRRRRAWINVRDAEDEEQ